MKKVLALQGFILLSFFFCGFTLNDTVSKKFGTISESEFQKISDYALGVRESFSFKSMDYDINGILQSLNKLGATSLLKAGSSKYILQHDMGSEEINFILECHRRKCELMKALLLMKPTHETLSLPKANAKIGLEKLIRKSLEIPDIAITSSGYKLTPDEERQAGHYLKGETLYDQSRYAEAIREYELFLNQYPHHKLAVIAQYFIGKSHAALGNCSEATAQMQIIQKAHSNSVWAKFSRNVSCTNNS